MAKFKDSAGREWEPRITVWELERVTAQASTDIDNLLDDKGRGLLDLFRSSLTVAQVVWVLIEEAAKKTGINREQFFRSLAGDSLEDARLALYEAIADFYPPQGRTILRALGQAILAETASGMDSPSSAIDSEVLPESTPMT